MRRVDCRRCAAVVVEEVPWGDGKRTLCKAYMLFLARWARRLSWKETAEAFRTSWDQVFDAVEHVVAWGLEHRKLGQIDAIGVDEIQYAKGHKDAMFYRQMHGVIANNIILHSAANAINVRCNTGGTGDAPLYVVSNTITNVKGAGITYYGNSGSTGCSSGACKAPAQLVEYLYVFNNIISCGADTRPDPRKPYFDSGIFESDVTGNGPCAIGTTNQVRNNLTYIPMPGMTSEGCPMAEWWVNVALSTDTIYRSELTPDPNDPNRNPSGQNMFYTDPPGYNSTTGQWIGGDYTLMPGSKPIDTGKNLSDLCIIYPFLCTDYDGVVVRPQGLEFDMGAYEASGNRVFRAAHN
jgi:hypothetical protein